MWREPNAQTYGAQHVCSMYQCLHGPLWPLWFLGAGLQVFPRAKPQLFVQEIANHMEKDTETHEVVQEAIDTMQRVAWHINDMKRKHEHAVRLQVRKALPHSHRLFY